MTRFLLRLFRSDPWVMTLLALLTFAVALASGAAPRMLSRAADEQLRATIASVSATQRNPTAVWTQPGTTRGPHFAPSEGWDSWAQAADDLRESLEPPLSELVLPARLIGVGNRVGHYAPSERTGLHQVYVRIAVNPDLERDLRLVEGAWPRATPGEPVEVVLVRSVADRIEAKVGDVLADVVRVVGLVEPADPDDERWLSHDFGHLPAYDMHPNLGQSAEIWGYSAPTRGDVDPGAPMDLRVTLWLPIDGARLGTSVEPRRLGTQLTALLATDPQLSPGLSSVRFQSELGEAIALAASQQAAARTLVAVFGAGPLGLAAALMTLGAALVVTRREDALTLLVARGASRAQLRAAAAVEGALLTVPAAALGHAVALAYPGQSPAWQWLLTLAVGAFPALALMWAQGRIGQRRRRDLSARGSRRRLAAELGVVVVAAAAVWQLLNAPDDSARLDVLAVVAPLLLALATALLAMRVLPLPLAALVRAFRRRRGLVGLLGSARALRDPAGGLIPTFALVLGVTVAVLGTVMLGTVTRGASTAAWTSTGADVKVNGQITPAALDAIRAIPGVTAADGLGAASAEATLTVDGTAHRVEVWVAGASLATVWADTPVGTDFPRAAFEEGAVVLGGALPAASGQVSLTGLGSLRSVGHADTIPGTPTLPRWVLVSRATWEAAGRPSAGMSRAFIALDDDADPAAIAAAARQLVPQSEVQTVASTLASATGDRVTRALTVALVSAAGASVLLIALALVVVQVMGARSRAELLAVLRTQGLAPGQGMGIVAWEVGPLALLALLFGTAAGVGIAALLVAAMDLTGLTGGRAQPALAVDPLALVTVVGVVVGVLAAAVTVTSWAAGRTNLAQQLKIGERR